MTADDATGRWPESDAWPEDDAPPAEWARFYRDRLGLLCLPTPGLMDTIGHARSIARRATIDFVDRRGREPTDEESVAIWDDARAQADRARKGPIGYFPIHKFQGAADVTDKWIATFWEPVPGDRGPRGEADQRGICVAPNRSAIGLPLVLVDVDPRHGGDVAGEWGAGLPGPKASTASGEGVHTFVLGDGAEHNSQGRIAPGVDVVARGTPILVPAGSATPTRRWLCKDPPRPSPEILRRPPPPRARDRRPPRRDLPDGQREPGDDDDPGEDLAPGERGRTANLVAAEVGDGERNDAAADIIGMLARPRACPNDFVLACLELLAEDMAGRDIASPEVRAESARWRHLLTRGPRDADFAAEVLGAWIRVRQAVASGRAWSESDARRIARSMWKSCDRHEGGHAGAEDFGVGPVLAHADVGLGTPGRFIPAEESQAQQASAPAEAVPYPPPSPEVAAAAVAATASAVRATWRGGVDPRKYLRTLEQQYTDDDLAADEDRSPIRIDKVFPAVDFVTEEWLTGGTGSKKKELWHGWGEWLGRDLGGLAPRDFRVIGATGAGAGKTWFEGWLAHGLALATAARVLGAKEFQDAPLVLPVWLTEMPKPGELFLRLAACHLGVPMDVVTEGTGAADSPRVAQFASRLGGGWTPHEVVQRGRELLRKYGSDDRLPLGFARRHVIRSLAIAELPRVTRHHGVVYDHRGGVGIVDHLADAIDVAREDLARLAGVTADKILPLALIDPGQRFTSSTESSEKRAIDGLFEAIRQTLCLEVGATVIATSDTTKAAGRESGSIDAFLSLPAGKLGADIFAGSQAIQHQADCIALQAEPVAAGSGTTRTWVRTFKSRAGGSVDIAYPFTWEMGLGRFVADEPKPLRAPVPADGGQGGRSRAGSQWTPAPPMGHGGPRAFVPSRDLDD